jgi:hypothetical protein
MEKSVYVPMPDDCTYNISCGIEEDKRDRDKRIKCPLI